MNESPLVVSGLHIEERRGQVSKKWKIESEQECCFLPHYSAHCWCCSRAALPIEGRVPGNREYEHQLFKVVSTIIALSWSYLFWSLVPLLKVALRKTRWQMKGEEEEKEQKWSNSDFYRHLVECSIYPRLVTQLKAFILGCQIKLPVFFFFFFLTKMHIVRSNWACGSMIGVFLTITITGRNSCPFLLPWVCQTHCVSSRFCFLSLADIQTLWCGLCHSLWCGQPCQLRWRSRATLVADRVIRKAYITK